MGEAPKRWKVDDIDLIAMCALLGIASGPSICWDLDAIQKAGRLSGSNKIGDFAREWLVYKLQELGRIEAQNFATPREFSRPEDGGLCL